MHLGQVNNNNIVFETINTFVDAYAASYRFYINLAESFADASLVFSGKLNELKAFQKPEGIEKVVASKVRDSFDANFREESFVKSLAELLDSQSRLAKLMGLSKMYQWVSNLNSSWNMVFIEPLRDIAWRSPSHKIYSENKYALFITIILTGIIIEEEGRSAIMYITVQQHLLIKIIILPLS